MGIGGIMYLKVNINLEPEQTEDLEKLIEENLKDALIEALKQDKNYLNKVIRDCVKGQIHQHINEVLQDKEYKRFLRDRVMEYMGLQEEYISLDDLKLLEEE